ncbi:helix-turn-helix domain-containing protein [Guyparkeria sp. TX1]|uniref:helix-turn-helix domain-containing protein n=1 Tax=Guyparkeria sp. TX1 TaxID=3115001 RepID=UPI0039773664
MSEQERREPAVGATAREPGEAITLGQEAAGPSVGERIRGGREAAGLSAADLAQPLNLDLKVIECIERDELDAVPGRPYILAYLRAWAGQLGLDGDELIAQYNAQRAPDNGAVQGGIHPTLDVMEPRGGGSGRRLLGWLGILIVIAIVVLALSRLDADRVQAWWSDLQGETTEPSTNSDSVPVDEERSGDERPAIEGALDEPPAPPTEAPSSTEGAADETSAGAAEGISLALPAERLAAIGATTEEREPVESGSGPTVGEGENESNADESTSSAADKPPALLLRATGADSWVEVRDGNGERLMYDVLAAGEEREFADATGPFSLVLGQPEGLEVEYQGEPVELGESSGDTGVLRTTVGNS